MFWSRRLCLAGFGFAPLVLLTTEARATLVRGLDLRELVQQSSAVLELCALDAESRQVELKGQRMIVTDTRVRVDALVARNAPASGEILVRTLGGVVSGVGELVHGQAELVLGVPFLGFLTAAGSGEYWFTGMAQGHYPIVSARDREPYLTASPQLPKIREWSRSAVKRLAGQPLLQAKRLVREHHR